MVRAVVKFILKFLGILFVLLIVLFLLVGSLGRWDWEKSKIRLKNASEIGMTIVPAINKYTADQKLPPPDLQSLVPKYLKQIPLTDLLGCPDFKYEVFSDSKESLVWYDLGSRNGEPKEGLWVYIDGESENAILVFELNEKELVTEARVDRMPKNYKKIDFNKDKWLRHESRIGMVRDLADVFPIKVASLSDIKEKLGEPSGFRILRNSPWELQVEKCSDFRWAWDSFFYWPTEDYPEHVYGGSTELIGKWAYVHE